MPRIFFVVDLVKHFFVFEKNRTFLYFFNFVTPYSKFELLVDYFTKALTDSKLTFFWVLNY